VLSKFFSAIKGLFLIEALRKRLFYTTFVLAIYRLGKFIPLPGIDLNGLSLLGKSLESTGVLGYLNMVSGGAMTSCSVLSLGISPYISASIIMQILQISIPYLEALSKEGESGRNILSRYTRYLAFCMSLVQGAGSIAYLERGFGTGIQLVADPSWFFRIKALLIMSVGSMFVMWLGEQISRFGIGQGSSILVFAGIVSAAPMTVLQIIAGLGNGEIMPFAIGMMSLFVAILTICIIFLERGERRVTVYYAKRVVGRASSAFSGVASYIPFKINSAGVMPVILAQPMLVFVTGGFDYLTRTFIPNSFLNGMFLNGSMGYNLLTVIFIVWFNFAFLSLVFNPFDLADNLRKSGGFLPGIRPGVKTAEYIDYLLSRIGTPGAMYMATLAILPSLASYYFSWPYMINGLSLLIAVGVALDTSSQVESYFIENRYEGFLATGQVGNNR
jgi:preprotein translocase subunit SecY